MKLLIVLVVAVLFVAILRKLLGKFPLVFYMLALLFDLLLLYGYSYGLPVLVWKVLITFQARGLFAFSLFFIVMIIGALKDGSRLKNYLVPVRAELSIVASILIFGHAVNYIGIYIVRIFSPSSTPAFMLLAFIIAALMLILLIPLTITSFHWVKKRMKRFSWKNLQRFAYVFFALTYIHITLMLLQPALSGGEEALMSLGIYTAMFVIYGVLRLRRLVLDSRERFSDSYAPLDGSASL